MSFFVAFRQLRPALMPDRTNRWLLGSPYTTEDGEAIPYSGELSPAAFV